MTIQIANDIVKIITDNYGYHFGSWQPKKVSTAIWSKYPDIAMQLNYADANALALSLAKVLDLDITDTLVNNQYPVWVDIINPSEINPINDNVVITYVEHEKDSLNDSVDRIRRYAESINADFVLLTGRTQGFLELEFARIKPYVEKYNRTIFFSIDLFIKDDCPNLFDIVPEDKIGIHDMVESLSNSHPDVLKNKGDRMFLLKSELFRRYPIITSSITASLSAELEMIQTSYSSSVIVCSKSHSNIWEGISFPFTAMPKDHQRWIELLIYRDGYNVHKLEPIYNQQVSNLDIDIKSIVDESLIIKYNHRSEEINVRNEWLCDNNLIGYKNKEPMDMNQFRILVLTHTPKQKETIQDREYLEFVDLNNIETNFPDSFTESRMFYQNFDELFPSDKRYVGLVTGSWNKKYVGLNPIDEMHNWKAIRRLDDNAVICSDIFPSSRFVGGDRLPNRIVLKDIISDITSEHINEFINLVGLKIINKDVGVSNQIIGRREVVKSLFDFYQQNEILEKISYFYDKYNFTCREKEFEQRVHGYFSETVTVLWMASQEFITMPQEILKKDWYW